MYFQQTKLSKSEWEYCEIPVSQEEKKILNLIKDGYYDINIKYNDNKTLIQHMKIQYTPAIENYLYVKYFKKMVDEMVSKTTITNPKLNEFINTNFTKNKQSNKADLIRLSNLDLNIEKHSKNIFEFVLLEFCKNIYNNNNNKNIKKYNLKSKMNDNDDKTTLISYNIYNLIQLKKSLMVNLNSWVEKFVNLVIDMFIENKEKITDMTKEIFHYSPQFIEKNKYILKYENKTLYDHQKQLFSLFIKPTSLSPRESENKSSKLVFYTAPTGTGKTLSPLGLSNQYKIIYICASRHIGLAFAKNAISIDKKVAFAFGCETSNDIRLHYFSAKDYEINRKSGGIYKVDNSNGEKVEIMICDVASYIIAMYYMLSFNKEKDCIMYWDEPTISLDATTPHPLHETIHNIWKNNSISNIILSCATLPNQLELLDVIEDYSMKFNNAEIHTINSYECKKTISLINKDKYTILPHLFFENYSDIIETVKNCKNNKTILRYFDLKEIVHFVEYILNIESLINKEYLSIENYFQSIENITMNNIKIYYLDILASIDSNQWNNIYNALKCEHKQYWDNGGGALKKINSLEEKRNDTRYQSTTQQFTRLMSFQEPSKNNTTVGTTVGTETSGASQQNTEGILLTTVDAHTLTDGATIFFAEDVEKIGRFMIHQSKIPEKILSNITEKIIKNRKNQEQIENLLKTIDDKIGKDCEKVRKMEKENLSPEIKYLMNTVDILKNEIKSISLEQSYIPNTNHHQMIWWNHDKIIPNAFISNIDENTIKEVMELDITTQMKLLLLMGIGVFSNQENTRYTEIMKKLVFEEKLYLIIANSDFIYGMNYQMCHSFFGRDLKNMTQQKIIQAIGRIGRGNIQQEYTIRIRDDEVFRKLFLPQEINIEAENMCRLFSSND